MTDTDTDSVQGECFTAAKEFFQACPELHTVVFDTLDGPWLFTTVSTRSAFVIDSRQLDASEWLNFVGSRRGHAVLRLRKISEPENF